MCVQRLQEADASVEGLWEAEAYHAVLRLLLLRSFDGLRRVVVSV